MFGSFKDTPPGYKNEVGAGKVSDGKIYIGIVKNNVDIQRMGRLQVYIPELGGSPDDPAHWFIVSYASPFAGVSDPANREPDSQTYDGSQQSYGWWMIPPDLQNQVLVCFVNGDHSRGFWFACIYSQNMNHMVPGVAIDKSFENNTDQSMPPVVEYNKADKSVDANNPTRPRFDPLALGLTAQGLTTDFQRGATSASARREAPSEVFGFLTPRANQVYVDDNSDNEYIRLRTRSGTQVLIHETNGYVYINSGNGNSWVEVSDSGVNIYTSGSLSAHAGTDINFRADNNINIDAGNNINVIAGGNIMSQSGGNTSFAAAGTLQLFSTGDMTALTQAQFLVTATGNLALTSQAKMNMFSTGDANVGSSGNMITSAGGNHTTQAGTIIRSASSIKDNSGSTSAAAQGPQATQPPAIAGTQQPLAPAGTSITTPVSVLPTHEPWAGHPKAKPSVFNQTPYSGSVTTTQSRPAKAFPGQHTVTENPALDTTTGDGKQTNQTPSVDPGGNFKCCGFTMTGAVYNALKTGSQKSGCDLSLMMGICAIESALGSAKVATTSSARGLFQFISGTWSQWAFPHGYSASDVMDDNANAYVGGLFTANNVTAAQKALGKAPGVTDVYMCHFMGTGGGSKFLKTWVSNPQAPLSSAMSAKQMSANAGIGPLQSWTCDQFYQHFYKKFSYMDSGIKQFISQYP